MWDGQSWPMLIERTSTPYIKEGLNQCNVLKIAARDSVIEFYCNGAYLNEIKIKNLFSGRVGVFVTDSDDIQNAVEFDNFYICEYPGEPPITDIEIMNASDLPSDFMLSQNYPNPFNPQTEIQYTIPKKSRIQLKIYNTLGEDVISLVNEEKLAGTYKVQWNGKNEQGNSLPSGLYYYCLKADNMIISTNKMILLR